MQYTPHYNLNLPEGTDIVNPLVQDNPNYTAIDTALYNNKLRVVGTATPVKTGTNHAITLGDSDINQFKFVATGDYASGDTFTVDGVTVTARIADGSSIPTGAFKINSTVLCILDGTVLNLINAGDAKSAGAISYDNTSSGLTSNNVQGAIDEIDNNTDNIISLIDGAESGIAINSTYVNTNSILYNKFSRSGYMHNLTGEITTIANVPAQATLVYPPAAQFMPDKIIAIRLCDSTGLAFNFGLDGNRGLFCDSALNPGMSFRFNITWYHKQ